MDALKRIHRLGWWYETVLKVYKELSLSKGEPRALVIRTSFFIEKV